MPRLTVTEVAAHVGVNKSTVSRQARANGLVGVDGKIDLAAYEALRGGLNPLQQTSGPSAEPLLGRPGEMAAEKLAKLAADREKAEIELAERKGLLVRREEVAGEEEDIFRQLRDLLMQMPRELGEQLADIDQPTVIEARIRRALNAVLRNFADKLEQEADAAGRPEQRQGSGAPGSGEGASAAT